MQGPVEGHRLCAPTTICYDLASSEFGEFISQYHRAIEG
jgi:hypothetical protein